MAVVQRDFEVDGSNVSGNNHAGLDVRREEQPSVYFWLVVHRRLVLSVALLTASAILILVTWVTVSGTAQVANQLSYFAGTGLVSVFLLGLGLLSYWAEQRERELGRIRDLERAVGLVLDYFETEVARSAEHAERDLGEGNDARQTRSRRRR